ncbi:MAG TPA: outer membrane beta-barrel protein [Ohtaekwangia sp.]
MKKIFLIILLGSGVSLSALAQSTFSITYPIAIPTSGLGNFIGQASFRGINLDYRYRIQPDIALGVNFAWNVFYEDFAKETYTLPPASLTGKQYRYSNNFPMLATATYFIADEGEQIVPFVTLGVGTMYTRHNTDMNLYTFEREAWNFALQPEVGIHYSVSDETALSVSVKYLNGFKAGNEITDDQSFFAINLGFAFH